jgi:hypothetical protein
VRRYRLIQRGTKEELAPLRDNETSVRVSTELPDDVWQAVAEWFVDRPGLLLSLERGENLEMLRWFPGLRRLQAPSTRLRSLDGLRHVADTLEHLLVGDAIPRVSLRPLAQLRELQVLDLNGSWADLDTLSRLTTLREIGMGSIDLELLRPLERLERFHSGLGTVRSLELLPDIGRLELVELFRLRGPHDMAPLGLMPHLRWLVLDATSSVAALPSFRDSPALRWVVLEAMKGIRDLQPVADAPNLEVVMLIAMNHLAPENLAPFVGHPTLRAAIWGLGSARKNAAAQTLVPLPPEPNGVPPWTQPDWTGTPHWNRLDG